MQIEDFQTIDLSNSILPSTFDLSDQILESQNSSFESSPFLLRTSLKKTEALPETPFRTLSKNLLSKKLSGLSSPLIIESNSSSLQEASASSSVQSLITSSKNLPSSVRDEIVSFIYLNFKYTLLLCNYFCNLSIMHQRFHKISIKNFKESNYLKLPKFIPWKIYLKIIINTTKFYKQYYFHYIKQY